MPREISDIKSFIEICRRKDASCTFSPEKRKDDVNWRKSMISGENAGRASFWDNMRG